MHDADSQPPPRVPATIVDQGFGVLGMAAVLFGQVERVPGLVGGQSGSKVRSSLFGAVCQRSGSFEASRGYEVGLVVWIIRGGGGL